MIDQVPGNLNRTIPLNKVEVHTENPVGLYIYILKNKIAISKHPTIINSTAPELRMTQYHKVHFFFKSTAQQKFLATGL